MEAGWTVLKSHVHEHSLEKQNFLRLFKSVAEAAGTLGIATFIYILTRTWSGVSLSPVPMLQHLTSDPRKRLTRHL